MRISRTLPFRLIPGFDGEGDNEPEFDLGKALANPKAKAAIEAWAEREIASGLKTKNNELLGKLKGYQMKVMKDGKEVEEYIDPEEAVRSIKFMRENPDASKVEERITAAVREANERAQSQIQVFQSQIQQMRNETNEERSKRYNLMVNNSLTNALIDSGIKEAKLPLHQMYLQQFVKVNTEGNGENVVVLDDKGNIRYGSSGPMTVQEFIAEYSQKKGIDEDWKPNVRSGSGSDPMGGGTRRGAAIDPNLPPAQRLALARRQGITTTR